MFSNPFSRTESSVTKEPVRNLASVTLSIIPTSIRKSVAVMVGVGMLANSNNSASAAEAPNLSSLPAEHRRIVDTYNTNLPTRLRPFIEQYEALIRSEVVPSLVDAKKSAVKAGDIAGAEKIDKAEKAWLALADSYRGNKTQVAWGEIATSPLPAPIQSKVDFLRGQYDQSENAFNALYEQAVGRLVAVAQQAGDLSGVKAAQALLGFKRESVGAAVVQPAVASAQRNAEPQVGGGDNIEVAPPILAGGLSGLLVGSEWGVGSPPDRYRFEDGKKVGASKVKGDGVRTARDGSVSKFEYEIDESKGVAKVTGTGKEKGFRLIDGEMHFWMEDGSGATFKATKISRSGSAVSAARR